MCASAGLAAAKILIGLLARSTAVGADGFESAGDVFTSALVLFGLIVAARPPDKEHPYGHGRFEMLTGMFVGVILCAAGVVICYNALRRLGSVHAAPETFGLWPLAASIAVKSVLSTFKFRIGRRIQSGALVADAWNDAVDILSGCTAIAALALTLHDPQRFLAADSWGGFAVGVIVVFTGLRVVRDTSLELMDTMPAPELLEEIRGVALKVPGVHGVEKLYARKTGLQYHVDLHLEVDPEISVRASHEIAHEVKQRITRELDWIADVLVHVEPSPADL